MSGELKKEAKKENKKEKKTKKDKQDTALVNNAENGNNGNNGNNEELTKKSKKSKKSKEVKRDESEKLSKGTNGESMEVEINGKKEKKKQKKEANGLSNENQEQNGKEPKQKRKRDEETDVTSSGKGDEPKKKKKKKQKSTEKEAEAVQESTKTENAMNSSSFKKCFYKEHPSLKSFTQEAVEEFRREHCISVTGANIKPVRAFEESGFPPEMLEVCKKFNKPTPIQSQCWPIILSGHDVIGIAETGSGKTIAFTLPALVHIKDQKPVGRKQGPIVLVLSPTRELAIQIAEVCTEAGASCGIRTACIYGGVDKGPQKRALDEGSHIVVATPGRLIDLVNQGICSLDRVTYLIMDEADRMLDLGFEKDIRAIVGQTRSERQTLMFSATWPQAIQALAQDYLKNPIKVTIGSEDLAANHKVKQIVEVIDSFARDNRLDQLLREYHKSRNNRILIFVLYKKEATRVERMLQSKGWKVQALHGDVSQAERTRAMSQFKDGTQPLLVATDVAARGLDIPNVEYVINYSFPLTVEEYVHRIGRTGRGGKTGISYTFFTAFDKTKGGELVQILREANQEVPETLLKFGIVTKKKEHKLYGSAFKEQTGAPMPAKTHIRFDS